MTIERRFRRAALRLMAGLAILAAVAPAVASPLPAGAGPVAVTVRVFDGDRFVSDLGLKDFEIEEAGMRVSPRALFLVRKDRIERREGSAVPAPDVSRRLVLLFQLTDYHNKIPEALAVLFGSELLPTDALEIETPMRTYTLPSEVLLTRPRETLARELTEIVRKDVVAGSMGYNSALRDLKRLVRLIGGGGRTGLGDTEGEVSDGSSLEQLLMQYSDHLRQMEVLRAVDEAKLTGFARRMKGLPGRKLVLSIYQREFRPEISPQTLDMLVMANQDRPDITAELQSLFALYSRPLVVSQAAVTQAFADSGMDFYFLFMNRQPERIAGIFMREQAEDVFKALSGAAEAAGGATVTIQNPAASLAEALKAAEMSYILYYTPSAAAPRGTFIDIDVKVIGKDYRVTHRSGYLTGS